MKRKRNLTRFIDKNVSRNKTYMIHSGITGSERRLRRNKPLQEKLNIKKENTKINNLKEIFTNKDKSHLVFYLLSILSLLFMLIVSYNYYN